MEIKAYKKVLFWGPTSAWKAVENDPAWKALKAEHAGAEGKDSSGGRTWTVYLPEGDTITDAGVAAAEKAGLFAMKQSCGDRFSV